MDYSCSSKLWKISARINMVFKINGICKKYFFFISDIAVSESIISVLSVIRESRRSFTKIFYCKHDCDNLPIPCRSKSALVDFGLKFASLCALSFLKKIYALCIYTFEKIVSTTMMKRHFTNRWNIKHFVNLLFFFFKQKVSFLNFSIFCVSYPLLSPRNGVQRVAFGSLSL